ncbi:MAG TPA: LptA/OstA family protein [Lacunisphaera sp.]|jgi:lipopolysaccharide export system protein LptA|nr:LptA/OstA family protein [Lacunisphaera sp.]
MTPRLPAIFLAVAVSLPLTGRAQNAPPQNTVIECDGRAEMVSTDAETTITFRDNVRVTGTNMHLTCDYLEVVVIRSGDKAATFGKLEKFRSMQATGNVRIIQGDREAACGRAEVLPGQDKVVLTDHPVVVDHDQGTRAAGKTITMLRAQRQVIVEEPILTGPPIKDLGVDPLAKPAAPAAGAEKKP